MLRLALLELHFSSPSIFAEFAVAKLPATIPRKDKNNLFLTFCQEHIKNSMYLRAQNKQWPKDVIHGGIN